MSNTLLSAPVSSTGKLQQASPQEHVVVIFKTHLDVGFTDSAVAVLNGYLRHFIPAVLKLAKETRHTPNRYVWTTGSWLVYRFLEDAGAQQRKAMEEAILAGDFHWHALPFTTHSELMPPDLFRAGLFFSQHLDRRFGRSTISAKMTDVPGHTRGIVPILADAGIRFLHIGVNPASTIPDVPPCFRWVCNEQEIVVVYEKEYGSTVSLPGGLVLSVNLTNDNLGPHNLEEVRGIYTLLRQKFSLAKVTSGSLDYAAKILWSQRKSLPIVSAEIGDSWIHGVGADPVKVSRFRELARLRSHWIADGKWQEGSPQDMAFVEPLLLIAEHTWGMDIKTHLEDWRSYTVLQLKSAMLKSAFKKVARSWQEQRNYLSTAIAVLPRELRDEARHALRRLNPRTSRSSKSSAMKTKDYWKEILFGDFKIDFDNHGSIMGLRRQGSPKLLADKRHLLGELVYQTFSANDYDRFYSQYNTLDIDWARKDFKKWGMPLSLVGELYRPEIREIRVLQNEGIMQIELDFPEPIRRQGAPSNLLFEISETQTGLDFLVQWLHKIPTRMPEAVWLGFNTRSLASNWRFEKMGIDLDPEKVVSRGNRALHGVTGLVKNGSFSIESLDAILVSPGNPRLLDFNNRLPDMRDGIFYNLYNNVWGTNFPIWNSDACRFRFSLHWAPERQL